MTAAGQSRKDLRRLKRNFHNRRQQRAASSSSRGAKVSFRPLSCGSRVGLRRAFRVGAWNVRTLRGSGSVAQLTGELSRLRISVAALSKVRWPGSGTTVEGGYTIFWSGRPDGRCTGGVAIAGHLLHSQQRRPYRKGFRLLDFSKSHT